MQNGQQLVNAPDYRTVIIVTFSECTTLCYWLNFLYLVDMELAFHSAQSYATMFTSWFISHALIEDINFIIS